MLMEMSLIKPDVLIRKFYSLSVLAHIEHVNTKVGFHHEALGEFYEQVNDVKDRIAEYLIGDQQLSRVNVPMLEIGTDIKAEAYSAAEMLCSFSDDEAIENIAGEFKEHVAKLKYKLSMS